MISKMLSAMSSKADEVAMLEAMRKMAGHGTYLESVFTDEFMVYVKRAIQDDLSPDIAADLHVVTAADWTKADALLKAGQALANKDSTIAFYSTRATEGIQRIAVLEARLAAIRRLTD